MVEIDVFGDDVLTLGKAAKLLPPGRNGARPHLSTLIRWIQDGAPARDGKRVRLSATRYGNKWLTSRAAIRDFCERLTAHIEDLPAPMTPTRKARDDARTAETLAEAGI